MASKYSHNSIQQVDQATHGKEILHLIYSNNEDLFRSVVVEAWPSFTDHSIASAPVSYKLEKDIVPEENHLLKSGCRLKKLNFNKAPWSDIKSELRNLDWQPMEELAKDSPVATHAWFLDQLIPLPERLVHKKSPKKRARSSMARSRNLL